MRPTMFFRFIREVDIIQNGRNQAQNDKTEHGKEIETCAKSRPKSKKQGQVNHRRTAAQTGAGTEEYYWVAICEHHLWARKQ
ncbi:hypothetical protein Tco_0991511 [Tanacetum coccineum]|uniref:Uncharacterized protein n=1 Tax=Tanacetum coccineum TaxID=301880 RepID=A0ABQ5F177_9ASTR